MVRALYVAVYICTTHPLYIIKKQSIYTSQRADYVIITWAVEVLDEPNHVSKLLFHRNI